MFNPKYYSGVNLIMELALGLVPMLLLYTLSTGIIDFKAKVDSYIPSHEIQIVFFVYFAFGIIISILNIKCDFSKHLVIFSFEFISAFISILQSFAGVLIFFIFQTMYYKAFKVTILFSLVYPILHVVATNLSLYLTYQKQKNRYVISQ